MNAKERECSSAHCRSLWAAILCSWLAAQCGCGSGTSAESKAVSATAPARQAGEAAGGDWPVFRGNAKATGVASGELTDNPRLLWKYRVEKGAFEATPVVTDGAVYIGDMDGIFYAIDLESGQ